MSAIRNDHSPTVLLLVSGAKGAVGSTLAAAVAALHTTPETILPSLATQAGFPYLGPPQAMVMAGWDQQRTPLSDRVQHQGVLPEHCWQPVRAILDQTPILEAPAAPRLGDQVDRLTTDIQKFQQMFAGARPVLINLLPAGSPLGFERYDDLNRMLAEVNAIDFPDLAYVLAAILCGVPVVNFTPNPLEAPLVIAAAAKHQVPICGRDGKTGQTYLKVVLASALKARKLRVDGWYSLNILGNEDGKNLMNPRHAAGKIANKTELLDDILGYAVGERYGSPAHKVHIDYYPPRGDAKEAWDVIDFQGLFGLPMSLRLNLQGRDSILAAPMVLDLARWMAALQMAGRYGPVPELGFFFKKPVGPNPPLTFQDQLNSLRTLENICDQACRSR